MLMIRLQRIGRKKVPSYRVIVSEKNKDTQAGSLEILGQYDPTKTPKLIELKKERIEHWLSVGSQPSSAVKNLLINAGIMKAEKGKAVKISKKRQGKLQNKKAAVEAAAAEAKAAEEAAKAEAEAAKKAEQEAPVEEPKAEEAKEEAPTEEKKENEAAS